jgi:hypothetical protein
MPYKKLSRFYWTFSAPRIFRCFDENGLFQHPRLLASATRQLIPVHRKRVLVFGPHLRWLKGFKGEATLLRRVLCADKI